MMKHQSLGSPVGHMPRRALTRLRSCVRADGGATAVYVAVVAPLFIGAAGLAVDVGNWYLTKRSMQTGVDAAAYAAALEQARQGLDGVPDLSAMQQAADDAASRNGLATPVTLNNPPTSGLAVGDAASTEAILTRPAPMHFTGMFLGATPTIMARAVAKAVVADACVWALDPSAPSAVHVSGTADVELDCGVVVNSDDPEALDQDGTSCISTTSITTVGTYSGSCVSPEPEVYAPYYGDPLDSMVAPAFLAGCDYPSQVIVDASGSGGIGGGGGWGSGSGGAALPPVTLTPGVYCGGIDVVANNTAIFEPGLYVIKGGEFRIAGSAAASNNENASGGVTFYLTGSGSNYAFVTIEGGADVTLTPMTVPPMANVLFFQDRSAPSTGVNRIAGGASMDLTGMIYFPKQHVEFTGGSTVNRADIVLVSNTLTFTGNAYLNADYAESLLPESSFARLVE
jgi:Flp pilus assembly protein TadG